MELNKLYDIAEKENIDVIDFKSNYIMKVTDMLMNLLKN